MAFSYDLSTDAGKVRLLIPDSRATDYLLEDEEVAAFLALCGGNVRLAAADALDTIASNEALVQKAITLLDLRTDGPKVADALRKRADSLRKQAEEELYLAGDPGFEVVENPLTVWQAREYYLREAV